MRSTSVVVGLLVLVLAATVPIADAFIFKLQPGTKKCFAEELSTRERVRYHYTFAASYAPFVAVTLTGPDGAALYEAKKASRDHNEWIYPYRAGSYAICFNAQKRGALSAASTDVVLEVQDDTTVQNVENERRRRENVAKSDRRRPIMDQAAFIEQGVEQLHQDYSYFKERERAMRNTNESTNTRTLGVTVVAIIVVAFVSFLRFYMLRRYLQKKKILD